MSSLGRTVGAGPDSLELVFVPHCERSRNPAVPLPADFRPQDLWGSRVFLGAHPGALHFPYWTPTGSALGWPYCVWAVYVSHVCTTEPGSRGIVCRMRRLKDFERLPGIGPAVCPAVVTQHVPVPVVRQDPARVLIHGLGALDCAARLPGVKPQPCFLLVASGLLLILSGPALLRLGSGDVGGT